MRLLWKNIDEAAMKKPQDFRFQLQMQFFPEGGYVSSKICNVYRLHILKNSVGKLF